MSAGAAGDTLCFFVNGKKVTEKHVDPETTLLSFLREKLRLTGTKYGCGGGGCGACTVMVSRYRPANKSICHYSANACLLPLCQLHGAAITTVEGIGSTKTRIHPVQERIAKAHGSQCGFCTPGMVMSMYILLRNNPQPSLEDITQALAGNLCRCTGYRPIIDGCRTFCQETPLLFDKSQFLPTDHTQELIFPPELILMAETSSPQTLTFHGERVTCVSPVLLEELVQLKTSNPEAPLIMGNTKLGPDFKFKGVVHPLIISPIRVLEVFEVTETTHGVWVGTGFPLSEIWAILKKLCRQFPEEKTELFRALIQQLRNLGSQQICNVATLGGHIMSAYPNSDLNPILAAGNCSVSTISSGGWREVPLNQEFFLSFGKTILRPEEIVVSVLIPFTRKGELVRAFRQAPRKECAFATVTTGMRVLFSEGFRVVEDVSIYFGGIGPKTAKAVQTCATIVARPWNAETLSRAYEALVKEFDFPPSIPGGKAEFRRSLTLSFLFKFNLEVLQSLRKMNVIENIVVENMEPLPREIQLSQQHFQHVSKGQSDQDPVGRAIIHSSAISQATGEAIYCDDLPKTDGELFLSLVTSSRAHAKIINVDVTDALLLPGVVDVITAKDIPGKKTRMFSGYDEEMLAQTQVSCIGQIVCAVLADTRVHARRAASAVNISYEDLPEPIFTIEQALQKPHHNLDHLNEICWRKETSTALWIGALSDRNWWRLGDGNDIRKHDGFYLMERLRQVFRPSLKQDAIKRSSYFEPRRKLERGNVEETFKSVDLVHEGVIRIGGQEHFYMETQSILVVPVREQAEFKIYASSQSPTSVQIAVSETLAIPANRVSCHVKRLGGAFGGKFVKTVILACITSVAAWKTNCPVRCVLERGEDMLITGGRHPVLGKYKVGFQKDGRILAADIQIWTNAGNAVDVSIFVAEKILLHLDNAYNIPNLRGRAAACRTNLPSNTSFRGFGVPQVACVIENLISDVGLTLQRPVDQVREINMYKGPSLTHYKVEFSPENLLRCWDECKAKSDFCARRIAVDTFNEQNRWKKRGLSIIPIKYGIAFSEGVMNQSAALVNIYQDGSVLVTHGGTEMGQGVHTKMQQVASRELHIPMSKVYIGETSTNAVPNTFISAASFGTDANGMAVKNACQTLYQRLEPIRQKNPKGTWESWVSAAVMEKISLSATGFSRGPDSYIDWDKMEGQPFPYFTYGVCCSEVELDWLTGDYRTMRTNIVADVGQSLNPSVDIGQIEGAFMQGLGLFTMEELKFSPCGLLYTRGPSQYKIPAVCDLPLSFNVHLLSDSNNPHAIYSSKGIGEPTLFLGSSVFFAIKDAVAAARKEVGLSGPFSLDSPATAERICLACASPFAQV